MASDPVQAYLDARVEGAKTLSDAYYHVKENPEVFVAGVQYALDKILASSDRYGIFWTALNQHGMTIEMLHAEAFDILEKAKRGEPQ